MLHLFSSVINFINFLLAAALPMTGGDGPVFVTVMGLSLAGLAVILLVVLRKKGRKTK